MREGGWFPTFPTVRLQGTIVQSRQAFATVPINPFSNGPRADAYGLRDGLRRLPALDLPHNPLSTARRQPGILMHVHPVLRWNLKRQQPQLPRSELDRQPTESLQLTRALPNCYIVDNLAAGCKF